MVLFTHCMLLAAIKKMIAAINSEEEYCMEEKELWCLGM